MENLFDADFYNQYSRIFLHNADLSEGINNIFSNN